MYAGPLSLAFLHALWPSRFPHDAPQRPRLPLAPRPWSHLWLCGGNATAHAVGAGTNGIDGVAAATPEEIDRRPRSGDQRTVTPTARLRQARSAVMSGMPRARASATQDLSRSDSDSASARGRSAAAWTSMSGTTSLPRPRRWGTTAWGSWPSPPKRANPLAVHPRTTGHNVRMLWREMPDQMRALDGSHGDTWSGVLRCETNQEPPIDAIGLNSPMRCRSSTPVPATRPKHGV